jgi:anion-transporting  ArsA/GET3 family ATPase
MRKTIKLTERDLTRIIKKIVKEQEETMDEFTVARNMVSDFLEQTGGTLGARTPDEIMSSLDKLKRAIKLEENDLEVANKRPNPNWSREEDMGGEGLSENYKRRYRRH